MNIMMTVNVLQLSLSVGPTGCVPAGGLSAAPAQRGVGLLLGEAVAQQGVEVLPGQVQLPWAQERRL